MQAKFLERIQEQGANFSMLCIGLDPSSDVLQAWGLADDVPGIREFSRVVLELLVDEIGFIKPQVAFYERFGSQGLQVLEDTIFAARRQGFFVIADAKRGDIGSSMTGYADAWLSKDSPLRSDALTVSSYMGISSLYPTAEIAYQNEAGLFALCATSNPEAEEIQASSNNDKLLPERVVELALSCPTKNIGLVIGATKNLGQMGLGRITETEIGIPILAPGFGAQGAKLSDLSAIFGASAADVIPNISRSVLLVGREEFLSEVKKSKAEL